MKLVYDLDQLPAKSRVVLLLSGGFDSVAICLALQDAGHDVLPVTFNYTGRPSSEALRLRQIADKLGIAVTTIDLSWAQDARVDGLQPTGSRTEAWFPARNSLFLSCAVHLAIISSRPVISMGIRTWDSEVFDDSSGPFFQLFCKLADYSGLANRSNDADSILFLPHFMDHSFATKCYQRFAEILDLTWSCWRDQSEPCGVCAPCKTRIDFLQSISY